MARISTYPNDTTPMATDKVIGTDATGNVTKNFPLSFLTDFILDGNRTIGTVPPGHYPIVNEDGTAITIGGTSETFTSEANPTLTGVLVTLMRATDGRLLLLVSGFDLPYRIESFVGKTWTALGFTGANQLINTFTGFTLLSSGSIQYEFTIDQPGNLGTFTGSQTLSNFAISALDKRALTLAADVIVSGTLTDSMGNPIAGSNAPFILLTSAPQNVLANQIAILSATEQYYNISGATQVGQTILSDFTNTNIWLRVGDAQTAGGGFRFVFGQTTPATIWTVNHNRGGSTLNDRFVDVTIYENTSGTTYTQVIPQSVIPTDSNQIVVTFNTPIMGIALVTG